MSAWLRALQMMASIQNKPDRNFHTFLNELAEQHEDRPALLAEHKVITYEQLAHLANRCARWGAEWGLLKGDRICLLMPNCLEYLPIWAGLSGLGSIVALINSNLAGPSLAHCIDAANPKAVIVHASLASHLARAEPHFKTRPAVLAWGAAAEFPTIADAIASMPATPIQAGGKPEVSLRDTALYIYTSGTTGLPKAAKVSHYRVMAWSLWFAGLMGITPQDRLYNCLPMYHSIGGVAAPGAVLAGGGSLLIREKFSASNFWKDVLEHDCTIFQYIGELCRYLLNAPSSEHEHRHRLRLCCGNGLSSDVWKKFQDRYRIPQILEFYAATEGTFSLYNVEGVPGSIGRVPPFLPQKSQIKLIKHDIACGTVIRGADGYCVPCEVGETGEAIGRISGKQTGEFEGYTSAADSEKKVLRNVFEEGDAWFRTGDLMLRDKQGFFYFVDRAGDTFRWKGENVSTSEVRDVMNGFPGVLDASVYGVCVPEAEGRAGMAALAVSESFDADNLFVYLQSRLPSYACPVFLRISEKIEVTSTFKHKKADLVAEGFDPAKISVKLYFRDVAARSYVTLDKSLYEAILAGAIKL